MFISIKFVKTRKQLNWYFKQKIAKGCKNQIARCVNGEQKEEGVQMAISTAGEIIQDHVERSD